VKDLTQGPIPQQIVAIAVPIAAGMIFQTLYYLVDLYFVAGIGDTAIAGVGLAGNVSMVIIALTQMLGVGTVALVSHAAGRKDRPEANLIFNQSVLISAILGVTTLIAGYGLTGVYVHALAADEAAAAAGASYLYWYLPGLALQFALVAMGSALRGTGIVKPTMIVQVLTVVLNTILAPILIAGWGTHHSFGVAGAGLASTVAIAVGVVFLWWYFHRLEHFVALNSKQWTPHLTTWKRILNIGLPAGGEMLMIFVVIAVAYWAIRGFGPAAQAGFGVGSRLMQAIFLPAMAIAFAAAPVAGQNFGAGHFDRVKETFRSAAWMSSVVMIGLTALCLWRAQSLIRLFTTDAAVVAVGASYLQTVSWNFVPSGLAFTASSLFQAIGNTWPSLISSGTRLITYVTPVLWLGAHGNFELTTLWWMSVATVTVQALVALTLLAQQFREKLVPRQPAGASANSGSVFAPPSDH
jgi:putative MATE family efflux protein